MKKQISKFTQFLFGEREFFCNFTKILVGGAVILSARHSYLAHWASPNGFNEERAASFEGRLSEPQWIPPGKITVVGGSGPIDNATLEVAGTPTVKLKNREDFVEVSAAAEEILAGFTSDLRVKFLAKRGSLWFEYSEPVKLPDHPHRLISPVETTLRHEGNLVISCEQEKLSGFLLAHECLVFFGSAMLAIIYALLTALAFGVPEGALRDVIASRNRRRAAASAA